MIVVTCTTQGHLCLLPCVRLAVHPADWLTDDRLAWQRRDGANFVQAIRVGHQAIAEQCAAIQGWAAAHGKEKRTDFEAPSRDLDSHLQVCLAVRSHNRPSALIAGQSRAASIPLIWQ